MTLPADVARCAGHVATRQSRVGGVLVTSQSGDVECARCLRRTDASDGHPHVAHMAPPSFVGGRCPMRIVEDEML